MGESRSVAALHPRSGARYASLPMCGAVVQPTWQGRKLHRSLFQQAVFLFGSERKLTLQSGERLHG
jgi:hypothetical protein